MFRKIAFAIVSILAVTAIGCFGGHIQSAGYGTSAATPATIPYAPVSLTATAGNAQVALTWSAVGGATSYNVYFSQSSKFTLSSGTAIKTITGTTYTHTGLTNGTAYYYMITAVNSAGESSGSNMATATPVNPAPPAPTGLVATPGNGQVSLTWAAVTGATAYNIYYDTVSTLAVGTGTKVGLVTGTTYTVTGLTNAQLYYFIVTALNGSAESVASSSATATPRNGITINLTPGTAASGTLPYSDTTSVTFGFDANAVSEKAVATISSLAESDLTLPAAQRATKDAAAKPMVNANDTFIAAFSVSFEPISITLLNVPVTIGGSVGTSIPVGTTLNLAILKNNAWVDITTMVVGANQVLKENLRTTNLQGLLTPGTYLVYEPAKGTNTTISNLGIVLMADDGHGMADGSGGLQVIHLYDAQGALLTTPTIAYLDYSNAYDLDGQALTPDGSQGIMVDGGNTVRFFSAAQTGVPVASTTTLDITAYGGDGDSIAILPNGDEAIVSGDASNEVVVVSGILNGKPVAATTIATPGDRDGLVISNDGSVLLARGYSGITVYAVAPITPISGSIGGTVSHSYTQINNLADLGTGYTEDGRDGMAISSTDPTRAVVVTPDSGSIELVTGLPSTPVEGTALTLPNGAQPYSVSISPDGKLAIVGSDAGLFMYSGVDTGTLTPVGSAYAPTYSVSGNTVTLGNISTLGVTLDGKYVVVGDSANDAVVVIPYTSAGFGTPASVLGGVAIPNNDQMLIH
ncbi:MAG TPA: hypothetical protein VGG85_18495 [Terracidiphilus sp.]|jgi:hypothetical protein